MAVTFQFRRTKRRGVQTLEAIIALPVLVLMLAALFVFGPSSVFQQTMRSAADAGARDAGKIVPASPTLAAAATAIGKTVEKVTSIHGLTVFAPAEVQVIVEDGDVASAAGVETVGAAIITKPTTPTVGVGQVKVTVVVAGADAPVPNALTSIGLNITTKRYQTSATATKE